MRAVEEMELHLHRRPSPCWLSQTAHQRPFAKLFTKRSGRNKKKSLLRRLRSDFWFKGFSRPILVAILELCVGSRLFNVSSGVFTRVGLPRMLGVLPSRAVLVPEPDG